MGKALKAFIILFVGIQTYTYAQQVDQQVLLPSPKASAFHIYGDYPVNLSRGLVDISIPLYTIEVGDKKFPITLKYHAAGVKFYETEESNVATGWLLDYGGLISVTTLGKRDVEWAFVDRPSAQFSTARGAFDSLQRVYLNLNNNALELDGEYDIYNYDFFGKSGKFICNKDGKVIKFPYNAIKFDVKRDASQSKRLACIEAYDEDGTHFKFGINFSNSVGYSEKQGDRASSLLLAGIETQEGEKIEYTYYDPLWTERINPLDYAQVVDYKIPQSLSSVSNESINVGSGYTSSNKYSTRTIREITFPGGRLYFHTDASGKRVSQIDIYKNSQPIRKIRFNTTDFENMGKRYALNSLEFQDSFGTMESKYMFRYNPGRFPLVNTTTGLDYWGYYNGAESNYSLVPNFRIQFKDDNFYQPVTEKTIYPPGNSNSCTRIPNPAKTQAYMLDKITYPSGGTTEFVYENNTYSAANKLGGGLRISKIINDDGTGNKTLKTYKYGPGNLELNPEMPEYYVRSSRTIQQEGGEQDPCSYVAFSRRTRIYGAEMNPSVTLAGGNLIAYTHVEEYNGTENDNTGRTVYKYDLFGNAYGFYSLDNIYSAFLYNWSGFRGGNLIEKKVEKKNTSGAWETISKTTNTYSFIPKEEVEGLVVEKAFELPGNYYYDCAQHGGLGNYIPYDTWEDFRYRMQPSLPSNAPLYTYYNYKIPTGYNSLTSTTDTLSTPAGLLTTRTEYFYNIPGCLTPTIERTWTSKGEVIEKRNKYVLSSEYVNISPYSTMIQRNIVNPLLEQKVYLIKDNNEKLLETKNTWFKQFYTNVIKPEKYEYYFGDNEARKSIITTDYDQYGNLVGQSKLPGINIGYRWGYNHKFPVAQVTNGLVKNIFYESFEEEGGNSIRNDSKTGYYSYQGNFTKQVTGIDPGLYCLSYWRKTTNGWQLTKETVQVTNNSYEINLSGQLDEIAFYPTSAQMITFTYDPALGITSQMNAQGQVTYYEYDTFQRVRAIKDQGGNILKSFDYHYKP